MDREYVLSHQTVIVRNGLIGEIGDTKRVRIPKDAQRIDGAGKFLIPGLIDMHVHLFTDDEFPDALAEDEFRIPRACPVESSCWQLHNEPQKEARMPRPSAVERSRSTAR